MNFFAKSLSRFSTGVLECLENFEEKGRAYVERHRNEVAVANTSNREREVGECVISLSFFIVGFFHKSDLSEVEICESWITANLNELLGNISNSTDFVGIPYMRIYRRFRVMSQLNSWINTKEEEGRIIGSICDSRFEYLTIFPPDSTKFTIKKMNESAPD
jgi:hypothetical protein